jgi:hypothetical protein
MFDSFCSSPALKALTLAPCVLLLVSMCEAQQAHESYTVTGVVKNSVTGQPIARALVDGQTDAALTDSQGHFELHLPGEFAQLQVRRPGFTGGQGGGWHRIKLDAATTNLTLYLTPTATITGHVVAANGGEVNHSLFTAYRSRSVRGHQRWIAANSAMADSEGVFRMYDVEAPAKYILCSHPVTEQWIAPELGKTIFGYPSRCYPSGLNGDADALNLSAGQQADVEIPLARQRFYPVTISEPNYPLGGQDGVNIQISNQNGLPADAPLQWNEQTRTAEMYLPNGNYYAEARSWGKAMAYGRVDFRVADASLLGLRLLALPLAPVAVEVHKEFTERADVNNPAVNRFIVISGAQRFANPGFQLQLMPVDRITESDNLMPLQYPEGAEDGNELELNGVFPGRYWVQASYFLGGYVSAITSGGVDLTKDPLVLGAGNSTAPIEITLRNDGGTINCILNSSLTQSADSGSFGFFSGASGVAVYAIPMEQGISYISQAEPVMNGRTRISNLAPGTYSVVAFENYRDLNSADSGEVAHLAERGKVVTVPAGGTVNVQLGLTASSSEEQNP